MASINLANYDKLIVSDQVAERVKIDKESTLDDLAKRMPYTIEHNDGLWSGSIMDIKSVNADSKKKPTHYLKREDELRFHNLHGYGKYKTEYITGYGVLDIATQYMIGTGQAKLVDMSGRKTLVLLNKNDATIKWAELWEDYLTKLDPFNELKSNDNINSLS